MIIRYSITEIDSVAKKILFENMNSRCFAFFAEMGSGKTTLIHTLCKLLGTKDAVSSPTYSIINEYQIPNSSTRIFHMDWYRLKNTDDAFETGVQDILENKDDYIFIEWPEKAVNLLPKNVLKISIKFISENERELQFTTS